MVSANRPASTRAKQPRKDLGEKRSRAGAQRRKKPDRKPKPNGTGTKEHVPEAKPTGPQTLSIDIGGTGIKMLVLDAAGKPLNKRTRELTPKPARPQAVLSVIREMLGAQPHFDRVSVGFPGVVTAGIVHTAANLGGDLWKGFDLKSAVHKITGLPVVVLNDADLQGFGVIEGHGVEMVLTLGTGIGVALYTDGHLVKNCELGHHPWKKGQTYEQRLSDAEMKRIGKRRWNQRFEEAMATLQAAFNFDTLYVGGGNARHLKFKLPENVKTFTNVQGLTGGTKAWKLLGP